MTQPKDHFDGYVWTFPKGRYNPELPEFESAQMNVRDKTGMYPIPLLKIPGSFKGGTSSNQYFAMKPYREEFGSVPERHIAKWVPVEMVEAHLSQTTNPVGKQRDFDVFSTFLPLYPKLMGHLHLDERCEDQENSLITSYALRFDGYAYTGQQHIGVYGQLENGDTSVLVDHTESFFDHPDYTLDRDYLCMILFFIQRSFLRECNLRWNSKVGQITRRLFLETYRHEVPVSYRNLGCFIPWQAKSDEEHESAAAFVRMRHQTALYFVELRN